MSVTINAKGTSVPTFAVGKNGMTLAQAGEITPPAGNDLTVNLSTNKNLVIDAGNTGPALITATNDQDLHINPATGGGQYLFFNATRWPATPGGNGQTLVSDGNGILSWTAAVGTGTVSSVAVSGDNGIGVSGSPITASGTISLSLGAITPTSVAATGTVTGSNLSGTNTGDQTITLTGDVTGSGTGSFVTTLATVNSSPQANTFRKITVSSKGLVTETSAVGSSDITTALGYTPFSDAGGTITGNVTVTGTIGASNLSGTNTGDQTITLTGDVTGSGTASFAATLATVNASPQSNTFRKITVNGKGLVTATSAVSSSDITTVLGYTPVNKAGDTMTGLLILSGDPTNSLGAATKQYVDNVASGLNIHNACETGTTAALPACTYNNGTGGVGATLTANSNGAIGTVGGYSSLAVNSRVLVKNQSAATQNGIYVVTQLGDGSNPWILTRASDFDGSPTSEIVAGDAIYVQEGTLGGTQWVQTAIGTGSPGDYIIVGTDSITFSQFSGAGTYTGGSGINISSNTISNTGVLSLVAGSNISVSSATGNVTVSVTGTVPSASIANTLSAARTISATGDATWSVSFDGSTNVSSALTLATVNASPQTDTFRKVTVNGKGLVTATSAVTTSDITSLVDGTYVNVTGDTMTGALTVPSIIAGNSGTQFGTVTLNHSGASYPALTLGSQADTTANTGVYLRQTSGQAGISTAGAGLSFFQGGPGTTESMRLDTSGNWMLATTTSFGAKASIQGDLVVGASGAYKTNANAKISVFSASNTEASISTHQAGIASSLIGHKANDSALYLTNTYAGDPIGTAGLSIMLSQTGTVGIGTTSTGAKVNIDSGTNGLLANWNSTHASGGYERYQSSGVSIADVGTGAQIVSGGYTASDFGINVRTGSLVLSTAQTSRIKITNGGNVLIGTTTDSGFTLDVNGTIRAVGTVGTAFFESSGARLNFTRNSANYITANTAGGYIAFETGGNNTRLSITDTESIFTNNVSTTGQFIGTSVDTSSYTRIVNPGGGFYYNTSSSNTGAIKVQLPVGMTGSMVRMTIKCYEYTTNEAFEIHVGGYNYSVGNTWANNPFAYIVGNPNIDRRFTVRFGYTAGGKAVIYIGELASTWSYLNFAVTDVEVGYSGNSSSWASGWVLGFEATAFENVTATITNPQVGYQSSSNVANSVVLRDGSGNFTAGAITATSFNATSTQRVKTAIKDLGKSYLDKFAELKPREYDRTDMNAHEFGFVAEEMAMIYPEIVATDADGQSAGIDYSRLSAILTAKVQEQQTIIDDLKSQVAKIAEMLKTVLSDK